MNPDLERQILTEHRFLYRKLEPRWLGAPLFECGDGWGAIIGSLSEALTPYAVTTGLSITIVKRKLGALRVHVDLSDACAGTETWEVIDRAIQAAAAESHRTCEHCGAPGIRRSKVRVREVRTLCGSCASDQAYDPS